MATRRPVVVVDGRLQELPTGDTIAGAVPETRTVAGKALIADVVLSAADVGAAGSSHSHGDATVAVSGFMSAADKTKLAGIATQATKNETDAALKSRANHTGIQALDTLSQSGATAGQVPVWNGSAWAPATVGGGGGGESANTGDIRWSLNAAAYSAPDWLLCDGSAVDEATHATLAPMLGRAFKLPLAMGGSGFDITNATSAYAMSSFSTRNLGTVFYCTSGGSSEFSFVRRITGGSMDLAYPSWTAPTFFHGAAPVISPDGQWLFIPNSSDLLIYAVDYNQSTFDVTLTLSKTFTISSPHGPYKYNVRFSPDGRYAAVLVDGDPTVDVFYLSGGSWSMITNSLPNGWGGGEQPLDISNDGFVIVGDRLARVNNGALTHVSLFMHPDEGSPININSQVFSPDGQFMLIMSQNNTIRIYKKTGDSFAIVSGSTITLPNSCSRMVTVNAIDAMYVHGATPYLLTKSVDGQSYTYAAAAPFLTTSYVPSRFSPDGLFICYTGFGPSRAGVRPMASGPVLPRISAGQIPAFIKT